jgi:cytoskeletal protein CcmA (bactofilin family)
MKRFGSQPKNPPPTPATTTSTDRTLIIGKGIVLAGEIKDCDCLVVEGKVDAQVTCKDMKIAPGGLFTGTATVINAEVIGRFEGELTITEQLIVRATGSVSGEVRYRQIEIERGGQISGRIEAGVIIEPIRTTIREQRRLSA